MVHCIWRFHGLSSNLFKLRPFLNSETWKYAIFCTVFNIWNIQNWAEISHKAYMPLNVTLNKFCTWYIYRKFIMFFKEGTNAFIITNIVWQMTLPNLLLVRCLWNQGSNISYNSKLTKWTSARDTLQTRLKLLQKRNKITFPHMLQDHCFTDTLLLQQFGPKKFLKEEDPQDIFWPSLDPFRRGSDKQPCTRVRYHEYIPPKLREHLYNSCID